MKLMVQFVVVTLIIYVLFKILGSLIMIPIKILLGLLGLIFNVIGIFPGWLIAGIIVFIIISAVNSNK